MKQISMFTDPIDEKVRDRLKMYLTDKWGKAFNTEKKIDFIKPEDKQIKMDIGGQNDSV